MTKALHDDLGHLGTERTVSLIRDRFYWPRMAQMVENYVKNCGLLCFMEKPSYTCSSTAPDNFWGPMELVCIDFLSLETDTAGFSIYLLSRITLVGMRKHILRKIKKQRPWPEYWLRNFSFIMGYRPESIRIRAGILKGK